MRAAREALGMTQEQIADKLGISQRFYAKIEKGETPGLEYRQAITAILAPQTRAREDTETYGKAVRSPSHIPIEGIVSAGPGSVSEWSGAGGTLTIPPHWSAVRVMGDSAYPAIYSGQLALVDESRAIDIDRLDEETGWDLDDDVVLVRLANDKALLKRFCFHPPRDFVLASVNGGRRSPLIRPADILHIVPVVAVIWNDPNEDREVRRQAKRAARESECT